MTQTRLDPFSLAKQFSLFADPTRLTILDLLMQGVQCNCAIGDRLGLPMNLISHHLKVLKNAGLVSFSRDPQDGRWIYYSVNAERVSDFYRLFGGFLNPGRIQERSPTCGPRELAVTTVVSACSPGRIRKVPKRSARPLQGSRV